MKKHIYWLALGLLFIISCQKEESFELGNAPAGGSLQDDASGDCLPKTVNGVYSVGQTLVPTTNTITVAVNVTKTGTYNIYTDTVNGYFFRGVGNFTNLGSNTVTLRGNGTPFAAGTNNFVVTFDTTVCDIQVTVVTPGAGTLAGAPNACAPIAVNGSYSPGVALTLANNAVVQVNVTTAGSFNFTTDTVAGIWFSFAGTLAMGPQSVTLTPNGSIPAGTTLGDKTFTVKLGASRCTFLVPVVAAGVATLGGAPGSCAPVTVNGVYSSGSPLTPGHNVIVQVTVATAGAVNITTNTQAGFSFAFSGTLAAGTQNVTLQAVGGPPSGSGTLNFTVTLGSSTCTFTVPLTGNANYTINCANSRANGTYTVGTNLNGSNTIFLDVTPSSQGNYSIDVSINGMRFTGSGFLTIIMTSIVLTGDPTTAPTTSGINNLVINSCTIPINVTGGPGAAVFTINCPGATANGTYMAGTNLNASNFITIPVNVTTAGTWSVLTTPVNGMQFTGSGSLPLGPGNITIAGVTTSGPLASSPPNFNIIVNGCSIPITVQAPGGAAVFTVDCSSAIPTGLYEQGTQLNPSNTVDIDVNVTTLGTYNITTTLTNGMTFSSGPGTFSTLGINTVNLKGSGTPTNAGNFNIPVPGTPSCNFPITVDAPLPAYHWQFTVTNAPSTIYRGEQDFANLGSNPPIPGYSLGMEGSNALGSDYFLMVLVDANSNITAGETYSTSAVTGNMAGFEYDQPFPATDVYTADPSQTGVSITFTVTTHNVATKTITGTFSGTAKNSAGQIISIASGTFTVTYP